MMRGLMCVALIVLAACDDKEAAWLANSAKICGEGYVSIRGPATVCVPYKAPRAETP